MFELLGQLAVSYPADRSAFDRALPELLTNDRMLLLVAESGGVVRGYALAVISLLLHTNGLSAQLQELVVDKAARGAGIGTSLLRAIEGECARLGVRQITVASRRAADFYAERGYASSADYLTREL